MTTFDTLQPNLVKIWCVKNTLFWDRYGINRQEVLVEEFKEYIWKYWLK